METTGLHDHHASLGARFQDGACHVASYGDAGGEYREALERCALVDLCERSLLAVSGPARVKFLQGMLTQDVTGRQPGGGCAAALLSPKGAIRALARVTVEADRIVLELDRDRLDLVTGVLEHHRVAAPVRFAGSAAAVLALVGPRAALVAAAAGAALPEDAPHAHVSTDVAGQPVRLIRAHDMPGGGLVLHVAPEAAAAVFEALRAAGARPAGREAVDARRIETLRPWGSEVGDPTLLHEIGLVRECHSATKGCYVGQEIVARLQSRGANVNKALRGLRLAQPALRGETIRAADEDVGRIATAAVSPRFGPVALGYVRRSHFAPGTAVSVAGQTATVVTSFEERG